MNILVVTQYFWPETFIINDLVNILHEQGNTVTVATGKPNYPNGKIFEGYTAKNTHFELYNNKIQVYRVPVRERGNSTAIELILNYVSFVVYGVLKFPRLLKGKKFDVIFVYAPSPITSSIPAIYLKWRYRIPLTIWIQDLWPESLQATGFVKNRFLLFLAGIMVRIIYSSADTLLVQSHGFINLVSKYANKDKVIYYPNSYLFIERKINIKNEISREFYNTLKNNFCLVFAGNLGVAQSLETIVNAASRIKHLKKCRIVIVGSGSKMQWLIEEKQHQNLENLMLVGRYPQNVMQDVFSHAAGLLVTLKRDPIFSVTIPSKVQSYLSAGRPIIAAIDGEAQSILNESGAGLTCDAEDYEKLAMNIEKLYHMSDRSRDKMGHAARKYFLDNFEMNKQAKILVELLKMKIENKTAKLSLN